MPSRWSPTQLHLDAVTPSLHLPWATRWRRSRGFTEVEVGPRDAPAFLTASHLQSWLAAMSADLRVRLVLAFGGAHRSSAWLGVSILGHAPRSLARLDVAAADLAEGLDVAELFCEVPTAGPRFRQQRMGLELRSDVFSEGDCLRPVLAVLRRLHRLDPPRALVFDIHPPTTSPTLRDEVQKVAARTGALPDPGFMALFDPEAQALQELRLRGARLEGSAFACTFRVALHGPPLGSLSLCILTDALAESLRSEVRFVDGPGDLIAGRAVSSAALLGGVAQAGQEPGRVARELERFLGDVDLPF